MDEAIAARVLRLIGLGVRSRGVVVGVDRVREAAHNGKLRLALVAHDASPNSLDKIVPLLKARHVRFMDWPTAAALGAAVGREQAAAVGVVDTPLADGIRRVVEESDRQSPEEGV